MLESSYIPGLPLIECTLNEIFYRHREKCLADSYMVDYNRREVRVRSFDNITTVFKIEDIVEDTRKEARRKGYNLLVIGGMYA